MCAAAMIDLAILGLLREQDLHGYELRKRATDLAGLRPALSFGALYPALSRLEEAGAVRAVEATDSPTGEEPALPLTGSLAGEAAAFLARTRTRTERPATSRGKRARKAYGLTRAGQQLLLDLMDDPATDDRAFPLKVAFCRYLPPSRRLELFERRRVALAGRLAGERSSRRPDRHTTVADRLDHYLRSLREHDHQTIQHDIAWLDELIADERAALSSDSTSREEGPPS
jgi:DNA-binding PadR family transcriptional regulator